MKNDNNSNAVSEKVFDYFVEEMLHGPEPPDLTGRILDAYRSGEFPETSSSLVAATLVEVDPGLAEQGECSQANASLGNAVDTCSTEEARCEPSVAPGSSALGERVATPHNGLSFNRQRVALSLGVAASLLFIVFGTLALMDFDDRPEVAHGEHHKSGSDEPRSRPLAQEGDLSAEDSPAMAENRGATGNRGADRDLPETLDLESLPFGTGKGQALAHDTEAASSTLLGTKLSDEEIVERLDQYLATIWDEVGVTPQPAMAELEFSEKLNLQLTGGSTNSSDSAALVNLDIDDLIRSKRFSEHWAQLLTQRWLRGSALPIGEKTKPLTQFLAQRIRKSTGWDEVVLELLSGELGTSSETDMSSASSVYFAALAGSGNHRLTNRIGMSFLNEQLTCSRCHDQDPSRGSVQGLGSQRRYWSQVAIWKGIEAKGNGFRGQRTLQDRQTELFAQQDSPLYFEQLDGQLGAALPEMPTGSSWRGRGESSPRAAFVQWLKNAPKFDQATVNETWLMMFGRHLSPQLDGLDVVALSKRREALSYLSEQFRLHDRNLSKLVGWLAKSRAFTLAAPPLDGTSWLASDTDVLERAQLAELVFASGRSLGMGQESRSLDQSLAAIAKWSGTLGGTANATLAQPTLAPRKKKTASPAQWVEQVPLSFAVHGQTSTTAESQYIAQILSSDGLSWEQRVAHVAWLSHTPPSEKQCEQIAANLINTYGNDSQAALLALLWAVKNSSASLN